MFLSLFGLGKKPAIEFNFEWYFNPQTAEKAVKSLFRAAKNADGSYTVLGLKKDMADIRHLVIPCCVSRIDGLGLDGGKPQDLESVFVGENVEEIGDEAFRGLPLKYCNLQEATRLKRVGKNAFAETELKEIVLPPQAEADDIGIPYLFCGKYEPAPDAIRWFHKNGLLFERDGTAEGGFRVIKSIDLPGCNQFGMRIEDFVTEIVEISAPTDIGGSLLERNSSKLMDQVLREHEMQELHLGNGLRKIWPNAFHGFSKLDLKKVIYGENCPVTLDAHTGLLPEEVLVLPSCLTEIGEDAAFEAPSWGLVCADGLPEEERKKFKNVKFVTREEYKLLEETFEYEVRGGSIVATSLRKWDDLENLEVPACIDELDEAVSDRLWSDLSEEEYEMTHASDSWKKEIHGRHTKDFAMRQAQNQDASGPAYYLGLDYMHGIGVEKDFRQARKMFSYVREKSSFYDQAQARCKKMDEEEDRAAEEAYRRRMREEAAEKARERKKELDAVAHRESLKRAIERDDRTANCWYLIVGEDYMEGNGTSVDYYKAYEMFDKIPLNAPEGMRASFLKDRVKSILDEIAERERAAREREAAAARAARASDTVPTDAPSAPTGTAASAPAPVYSSGADGTAPNEPLDQTYANASSRNDKRNYKDYVDYYEMAHGGNEWHYSHLAECYYNGWGCQKNLTLARRWYAMEVRHCKVKKPGDYVRYADMCYEGIGGPKDLQSAYRFYVASELAEVRPDVKARVDGMLAQLPGVSKAGIKKQVSLREATEAIASHIRERLGSGMEVLLDAEGADYEPRYPDRESYYRKAQFHFRLLASEDALRDFSIRKAYGSKANFRENSHSAQVEKELNENSLSKELLYSLDPADMTEQGRKDLELLKVYAGSAEVEDAVDLEWSGKDAVRAIVRSCIQNYWDSHRREYDIVYSGHPVRSWSVHYEW